MLIPASELSTHIGLSAYTILKLARSGKIPAYKLSSKIVLFDLEEVLEAIKGHKL